VIDDDKIISAEGAITTCGYSILSPSQLKFEIVQDVDITVYWYDGQPGELEYGKVAKESQVK